MTNMAKSRDKLYKQERALQDQLRHLIAKRDKADIDIAETRRKLLLLPLTPVSYEPKPDSHLYCGKICYVSQHAAGVAMRTINADLERKEVDPLKRSYFCSQCEAWHLTSLK